MDNSRNLDITVAAHASSASTYNVTFCHSGGNVELLSQPLNAAIDLKTLSRQRRDVTKWIDNARITKLNSRNVELQKARDFGKKLFEAIFYDEALAAFRTNRHMLQKGERLRLRLQLTPDLALLPWELLFDPHEQRFLALAPDITILRWLPDKSPKPLPSQIDGSLQMVVVLASPISQSRIRLDQELDVLQRILKKPIEDGKVTLDVVRGDDTLDQLRERLRKPVHILHILCHGEVGGQLNREEGVLFFEDTNGDAEEVNADTLQTLIQKSQGQTRLVVLNACLSAVSAVGTDPSSSVAAALVRGGVTTAVAMQFEFAEDSARGLSRVFYSEIMAGAPVDVALTQARVELYARYGARLDWAIPVLLSRSDAGTSFAEMNRSVPTLGTTSGFWRTNRRYILSATVVALVFIGVIMVGNMLGWLNRGAAVPTAMMPFVTVATENAPTPIATVPTNIPLPTSTNGPTARVTMAATPEAVVASGGSPTAIVKQQLLLQVRAVVPQLTVYKTVSRLRLDTVFTLNDATIIYNLCEIDGEYGSFLISNNPCRPENTSLGWVNRDNVELRGRLIPESVVTYDDASLSNATGTRNNLGIDYYICGIGDQLQSYQISVRQCSDNVEQVWISAEADTFPTPTP